MVIVILGYTGFIGSNILNNLIKHNSFKLICVGKNIKKKPHLNSKIEYYKWDFKSFNESNLFFLKKANVIINCVGKINNKMDDLENINFSLIEKLLHYIKSYQLKVRFVHLGSASVYGTSKNYLGRNKLISENSKIIINDLYSNSKLRGDLLIQNFVKKKSNKYFSYTILRITNVFGGPKKSNLIKFVLFSLYYRFWIRCFKNVKFNFINVRDLAQAVKLIILKLNISKNKIYIVSDDCDQSEIYENYQNFYKRKIFKILIPIKIIKILIYFLPFPKKIMNFFLLISNRVTYNNKKIRHEIGFKPKFSFNQNNKMFK